MTLSPDTRFCLELRTDLQALIETARRAGAGSAPRSHQRQAVEGEALRRSLALAEAIETRVRRHLQQIREGRA